MDAEVEPLEGSNKLIFLSALGANVNVEFYEPFSEVKIINSLGEIVIQKRLESKSFEISKANLGTGVFYLEVLTQNGTREVEQFLIE